MADHRFDYPAAGESSESSIVFVRGAQLAGDTPGMRLHQDVAYAHGGTPRARNLGAAKRVWPLTVIVASASEYEADVEDLIRWITDVAQGAVNAFYWTDAGGTVRRVRMVNGEFAFPKFGHDGQSCQLQLEAE